MLMHGLTNCIIFFEHLLHWPVNSNIVSAGYNDWVRIFLTDFKPSDKLPSINAPLVTETTPYKQMCMVGLL